MNYSGIGSAMLMTAGLGTRLRPYSDYLPKPLLPILGIPVAQFALDRLARAGVSRAVANLHHLPEALQTGLANLDLGGVQLSWSDERSALLGSGGGIRKALGKLGPGAFFLINADVLFDVDLMALAQRHRFLRERYGVSLTLTVFKKSPGEGQYREILVDPETQLIRGIGEKKSATPFFASVAVIESEAIENLILDQPSDLVTAVFDPLIAAGRAGAYVTQGYWHDIGSPELWWQAHLSLIEGLETGRLPATWRDRIERSAYRAAQEVWLSKSAPRPRRSADLAGPLYWNLDQCSAESTLESLGPGTVVYGSLPKNCRRERVIVFGGHCTEFG